MVAWLNDQTFRHADKLRKYGINFDIDTGTVPEDIWDVGSTYPWPAAAAVTTIVSASTDDDSAGVGARTVQIQGLTSDYLLASETVSMGGTTAVTLANQYLRVFRAFVITAGTGGVNVGNLDIVQGASTVARITADYGQTEMAIYTIPADYQAGYMVGWYCALGGTSKLFDVDARMLLQVRPYGGAWNTRETLNLDSAANGYANTQFSIPLKYEPKTDIRVRCVGTTGTNLVIAAGFDFLLVKP